MAELIGGFTVQEYAQLSGSVIFEARNGLLASIEFGEIALKELDPSHRAYAHVAAALNAAERAFAVVKHFDHEFLRRRLEAQKLRSNIPEPKD